VKSDIAKRGMMAGELLSSIFGLITITVWHTASKSICDLMGFINVTMQGWGRSTQQN
jgi:hypothetical protein